MPYKIIRNHSECSRAKSWAVVKQADGKLMGCHRSRKAAVKQIAALNAQENKPMTKDEFDALTDEQKITLYYEHLGKNTDEATWSRAFINSLPDASFAVIGPGGKKDSEGKTVPRTLRHLPHHGKITKHTQKNVDQPHLKNGATRANQIPSSLRGKGKSHLRAHYRALGWDIPANLKESHPQPLLESQSTEVEVLEATDDENAIARARFRVSTIDQRNRNGRVYPHTVWEKQVRRFTKGSVTGQDTHPAGGLFFSAAPKVTDAFLIFDKLEIVGHSVFGEALIVDTQQGRDFVAVAKAGAKIAVSTRGFGSVERVKKWKDGKEAAIVQDDYRLVGVDVLLDGYQSVPTAKMKSLQPTEALAYFVHEDFKEYIDMTQRITVEWLEENSPDVIQEIVHPFEHQVEDLEGQVQSLTGERDTAQAALTEAQAEVERLTGEIEQVRSDAEAQATELTEQVTTLTEQVESLTGERDAAQALAEARAHIFERVTGEPAAMLIAKDLLETCNTVQEVNAAFPKAKREAERLLASLPSGEPKSRYVPTETDSDAPDYSPEAKRYRVMAGMGV
jgi:polyhydroxyalkanoate synthesis regulator phasin